MKAAKESVTFSSVEVSEFTGVTLRQLQWWDEQGITYVGRTGSGYRREYTVDSVVTVHVVKALRDRGVSLKRIRQLAKSVQQRWDSLYLVVGKRNCHFPQDYLTLVTILLRCKEPVVVVSPADYARRMKRLIEKEAA